jgi:uncharacterized protein YeaO (DUF488 family)
MIKLKRAYETASKSDGFRILVDRLWPRGVSKAKAKLDVWVKEIAPSTELRKKFGHDPEKWHDFEKEYKRELRKNKETVQELRAIIKREKNVTFVYAARDEEHNEAVVLKAFIESTQ